MQTAARWRAMKSRFCLLFMRVWDKTDNSNLNIRTLMRNIHIASVCIFGIKYVYNNK